MTVLRQNSRNQNSVNAFSIDQPILVIEDQRSLGMLLKSLIEERWDCEVHLTTTLEQAVSFMDQGHQYLVALTDLNLPDAQYGEILDAIKLKEIPIIAMTGAFGEELREIMLKKGIVDYVLKDSINAYNYVIDLIGRLAKNRHTKVLVVDDSLTIRTMLYQFLKTYGLQVFVAKDGLEALAVLQQHPDILLMMTDYNMPEKNGFELIVETRKAFGKDKLAILGISSSNDSMISAMFLKNGANDFIQKPFNFEEVICRVNQNLEVLELIKLNQEAANRDYLTRLYNRRYFFLEGQALLNKSLKKQLPVAAAMLDLDHFKQINDNFGHDCGDVVLKAVANLLNEHFADHLPARLGGEEFAVLFAGISTAEVLQMLEKFRKSVEALVFEEPCKLSVTASIGVNFKPDKSLDELLRVADEKLYDAKNSGRNRVVS